MVFRIVESVKIIFTVIYRRRVIALPPGMDSVSLVQTSMESSLNDGLVNVLVTSKLPAGG